MPRASYPIWIEYLDVGINSWTHEVVQVAQARKTGVLDSLEAKLERGDVSHQREYIIT